MFFDPYPPSCLHEPICWVNLFIIISRFGNDLNLVFLFRKKNKGLNSIANLFGERRSE